ncbi:MAG: hypothetical protein EOO12_11935 [Chitinophagaceae bacterium]|nr:MAG: hypothetical protein EOO12_11935 [Chitinophagaceae bacterium]
MRFLLLLTVCLAALTAGAQVQVFVHLDTSLHMAAAGRLYLYTTTDTARGVPDEPDITNPQPMYARSVPASPPGTAWTFDSGSTVFSKRLSQLAPGYYALAALLDQHPEERGGGNAGNLYSRKKVLLHVDPGGRGEAHLYLDTEFRRGFRESDSIRLVELRSPLLSRFHEKEIRMEAAVYLPAGYDSTGATTYPVVYIIPGWGGTHYDAMGRGPRQRYGIGQGLPKIYVLLNPETQTQWGLHAFVDSRVNGPWGRALVEELIPYIREHYKGSPDPAQTFVMGQSSGGYPSLWLPLHYPKAFGGGWAVSPDPVDFSNFTGVNLYASNANFYTDSSGAERPFFLMNGKALTTNRMGQQIEDFQDNGGQQQSFEAEFGVAGADGRPKPLYNHRTGAIDPQVVREWAPYDLGRYVEASWKRVSKYLSGGKLHVYAGADDNFLLDGAVRALSEKAKRAGADIITEIFPGANHWTIWSPAFTARVQSEVDSLVQQARKRLKR